MEAIKRGIGSEERSGVGSWCGGSGDKSELRWETLRIVKKFKGKCFSMKKDFDWQKNYKRKIFYWKKNISVKIKNSSLYNIVNKKFVKKYLPSKTN